MALAGVFSPFLAMLLLQAGYAFMNITSKFAMESGMNPLVLVAYRQMFATLAIAPFAFFLERKTRPEITMPILRQILLCSLTGATGNQVLYFLGLEYSTPTVACALSNILPAATFILALLFGQESLGIRTRAGVAKIAGTILCVSGAMLLSFYHGHIINLGESSVHWHYADKMENTSSGPRPNQILGSILLLVSSVAWAGWFVIQARVNEKFPAPYTSTALMCAMATIQCGAIAAGVEHNISAWSLGIPIRLVGALYAGIVCSGIAYCVTTWCIQRKGPLYASVFSPLLLVIVAIFSWFLLHEKLYVGTAIGSVLIVVGLYAVLWGKKKETKAVKKTEIMGLRKLEEGMDGEEKGEVEWYVYNKSSKPNQGVAAATLAE